MSETICKFCGRDTEDCVANPCKESGRPKPPGSTIPQATPPKCQHCDAPLPEIGLYAYEVGVFKILNLWCPHCRRALHFQIFQAPPQEGGPRVQTPS
jgi:hypothetical protein